MVVYALSHAGFDPNKNIKCTTRCMRIERNRLCSVWRETADLKICVHRDVITR